MLVRGRSHLPLRGRERTDGARLPPPSISDRQHRCQARKPKVDCLTRVRNRNDTYYSAHTYGETGNEFYSVHCCAMNEGVAHRSRALTHSNSRNTLNNIYIQMISRDTQSEFLVQTDRCVWSLAFPPLGLSTLITGGASSAASARSLAVFFLRADDVRFGGLPSTNDKRKYFIKKTIIRRREEQFDRGNARAFHMLKQSFLSKLE